MNRAATVRERLRQYREGRRNREVTAPSAPVPAGRGKTSAAGRAESKVFFRHLPEAAAQATLGGGPRAATIQRSAAPVSQRRG